MPLSSRQISRRTTLAAAPLLALAGCRWGPGEDETAVPSQQSPPPRPDDEQVKAADQAIADAHALVDTVSRERTSLSATLAPLATLHLAHLDLLGGEGTTTRLVLVPGGGDRGALTSVRRSEQALQRKLASLAGSVSSGELARTLAAMAAAIAQHLQALPVPKKGSAR